MIFYLEENRIFVLETENTHYVFGIDPAGYNRHLHWGAKCDPADYAFTKIGDENSNHSMLDEYRQELTPFGSTVYRTCDLKAQFADGCREVALRYTGYRLEDDTLRVAFEDAYYPLQVRLGYRVYPGLDIIKRWVEVENTGSAPISFERLFSAGFSLPGMDPYTFENTNGAWGGEFLPCRTVLDGGNLVYESHRGASNHNQSPYFIAHRGATETRGAVYFGSLAYSGNFKVIAGRDLYGITRVSLGMNDFDFSHTLEPGAHWETPPVYCGKTEGLGEMSRQMNRFCLEHLLPSGFRAEPLPVLYNSWEATEFNVNVADQTRLAEIAAKIGVELFVMDDGWFGARNNDRAGLGDWFVNPEKFPGGLDELIGNVNALGMDFGLWVEPEMVNPDSDLYRAHPDWTYHFPHRHADELRHQLVLNMTRSDVQAYILDCLDRLLTDHNIRYIKWDMNRPFSQVGAENLADPKMYSYLHTMAVYRIVDELKRRHPGVQFESCASGGGRCDLGAISHFDQVWTSDNTDGIDRMTIQKGYSMLHPIKTMRAWVTDIAGINKPCSLDFRFHIAMQGALGLGGNLEKYSPEELEICRRNVALYKEIRPLVQFGDLYRILDADRDQVLCNQYVSRDKMQAVLFLSARGTRFFKKKMNLRFAGLAPDRAYAFTLDGVAYKKGGAFLMEVGLPVYVRGADYNQIVRLTAVE
jgi:alpha-galactosidase